MVRHFLLDRCPYATWLAAQHQTCFATQHMFIRHTNSSARGSTAANTPTVAQTHVDFAGDPDLWAKMMDLNLNTPMRLTARFAPGMVSGLC